MEKIKIAVKDLPEIPNICNQRLKEVWKNKDVSVAYVEMDPGNISFLHKHNTFTELYYILSGKGIMYVGNQTFNVSKNTLIEIEPGIQHELENPNESVLKHLVISTPPFNSEDLVLL